MAKLDTESTLKRLRNRYRMVLMNDDTYEEVVTFKLSRLSVYIGLSIVFVVLVGLTVALIIFTPLRYYIPGYAGQQGGGRLLRQTMIGVDSMSRKMSNMEKYSENIKQVLRGDKNVTLDTALLQVPKDEFTDE